MYKVNLLGKNTFTFQNIFPYEYPEHGDYDFDVFVTDATLFDIGKTGPYV